ncbi:diadenosine tetraphosphate hydrolase [Candidatus Woesearchaeota archaeon]|nr:diadenosine tetraphosphate hydrolase [Candidatus Woesearchaeota archaeon]
MRDKPLFANLDIITTEQFKVGQDWDVPIPGFFIITPIRRLSSVDEFTDEEAAEFIGLIRNVRKGMRETLKIKEVYLFQNEDAEQGFHLWVFPRHGWMERFGRKIQSVRLIMDYAKENMQNEDVFKEVKESVKKMKGFMSAL